MSATRASRNSWVTALAVVVGSAATLRAAQAITLRRWASRPNLFDPADFLIDGQAHEIITEDGASLFAMEAGAEIGSAPTLILGHGIAGDHTHWAPVANRLVADGFRVVIFDQRGHGSSTAGSAGFGLHGLAIDAAAMIDQLGGPAPIVYAGHSMGGIGAQALVRFFPETAARVAAFGFVATLPEPVGGPIAQILGSHRGLRFFRRILASRSNSRIGLRSSFGDRFSIATLDQLRRTWNQTTDETLLSLGDDLADFDFIPDLAAVKVPTLVVCGDRDTVTPLRLSEKIADALSDVDLQVVDGAGHMIVWEHVERLSDALGRLAENS